VVPDYEACNFGGGKYSNSRVSCCCQSTQSAKDTVGKRSQRLPSPARFIRAFPAAPRPQHAAGVFRHGLKTTSIELSTTHGILAPLMAKLANSRVLVTGADGFIGSHLAEQLVAAGAPVRALRPYNSLSDWFWLEQIGCLKEIEVVTGHVRDADLCDELTRGIDIVFHPAALIPIPYSYRAPGSFVDTNVKGTLQFCQAARRSGVKRFIQTSTSEVYGTAQYVPIDEQHPLQPQSSYSATKIASDCIALSFQYSFALPVVVVRPFNTYAAGVSKPVVSAEQYRPAEILDVFADTSRAAAELHCRWCTSLADGIAALVAAERAAHG
jgi:nucleoside-diphosphate-sugar epimerase